MRVWHKFTMFAAAGAMFATPTAIGSTAHQTQQSDLQLFVEKIKSFYTLLDSIRDTAAANAAAPQVAALVDELHRMNASIAELDSELVENALSKAGITQERITAIFGRFEQTACYGSTALAEALNMTPQTQPTEVAPTPEFIDSLGKALMKVLDGQLNGITGGPGLTEQTAWNLGNKEENLAFIATVMNAIPNAIKVDQNLVTTDSGAIYGRMRFKLPFRNHLYPLEMWFNLTHLPSAQRAVEKAGR